MKCLGCGFFSQGLCTVICGFEAGVTAMSWALVSVFGFRLQTTLSGARQQAALLRLGSQDGAPGVGVP